MKTYEHIPVLLNEVIKYSDPRPNQNFVDATLGGGGYTREILTKVRPGGKVLSIDLDEHAIENAKIQIPNAKNLTFAHSNFSHIDRIIKNHNFPAPDGIVADLGLSSYELDQGGRGISFQKKELLDMRFDQSAETEDARFLLNNKSEIELLKIFNNYGEDKFSRQIARKITDYRLRVKEIQYTTELHEIIKDALPKPVKHKVDDSARRIFQALRIAVNHELESLEEFLPKAFDILVPGGRLVIVSFHSLEDRIVKQFFAAQAKGCVCPIDFPQCICGKNPQGKILTKKVVTASAEEIKNNPRSNPGKLRAIQKI
jgi:16S rRNA (cytosine1402-N4)-methyltransferase